MGDINYGEYTWKNCKFSDFKGFTNGETVFKEIQKALGVTLELSGSYKWNVNYSSPPYVESIAVNHTTPGVEQFTLKCELPDNENPENWVLKVKSSDTEITHDDPCAVTLSDSDTIQTITEIAIGERTAHRIYNSYRWNAFLDKHTITLNNSNFTVDALAKAWGISSNDITINGSYTYIGTGWQLNSDFSISVKITQNATYKIELITREGQTILSKTLGNYTTIRLSSPVFINQISFGPYRNESYWPYGCKLEAPLPVADNSVRINPNIDFFTLKQYAIPKFYTDNRSISGHGWYRKARSDEILNNTSGYQTSDNVNPFDTNKPIRMLFLNPQLSEPAYTILFNGWDWVNGKFDELHNKHISIQSNKIFFEDNPEPIYELQPGDRLIRYHISSRLQSTNSIPVTVQNGPFGIAVGPQDGSALLLPPVFDSTVSADGIIDMSYGRKYGTLDWIKDEAFATQTTLRLPGDKLHLSENNTMSFVNSASEEQIITVYESDQPVSKATQVEYNLTLGDVSLMEIMPDNQIIPISDDETEIFKDIVGTTIWESTTTYQLEKTKQEAIRKPFNEIMLSAGWDISQEHFRLNISVKNIPWLISQKDKTIAVGNREGEGTMTFNGTVYSCDQYNKFNCLLFYNTWFPVFRHQQLTYRPREDYPNYKPVAWQTYPDSYWRPKIGLIPADDPDDSEDDWREHEYKWRENDCLNQGLIDDFYTYIIWHFQMAPDATTES